MAMKIQTRLPEPEDLKQEYPMTREMKEKKKRYGTVRSKMFSLDIRTSFSSLWARVPRTMRTLSANTWNGLPD